jgi:hypothetical protein
MRPSCGIASCTFLRSHIREVHRLCHG